MIISGYAGNILNYKLLQVFTVEFLKGYDIGRVIFQSKVYADFALGLVVDCVMDNLNSVRFLGNVLVSECVGYDAG